MLSFTRVVVVTLFLTGFAIIITACGVKGDPELYEGSTYPNKLPKN